MNPTRERTFKGTARPRTMSWLAAALLEGVPERRTEGLPRCPVCGDKAEPNDVPAAGRDVELTPGPGVAKPEHWQQGQARPRRRWPCQ